MVDYIKEKYLWPALIIVFIVLISWLHYNTPTMNWQYHLVYMQAYFIPILISAFQYGVRGGLGAALVVSMIYLPHIMFQWGGLVDINLMRFIQIVLFNLVGYLTGLKAQGEKEEKRRYQQAAEKLRQTLEQVKTQSSQISEMEQQLRAADRLAIVGELTASLAHEVRNPLGSIRGAVEIIRDAVPKEVRKLEFFDILIQETERLNRVVETYLSFSQKKSQRLSSYNLVETMRNILLMIGAQIRKSKIRLKTRLPEDEIILKGNPNQLWQVVMNVLLNAIQAMPDGGEVTVDIQKKETPVPRIFLTISDQGQGIPGGEMDKIFNTFYTTKTQGTGLGLAIVKRITDENNWDITVESTPGEGTRFQVIIPLDKTEIQS